MVKFTEQQKMIIGLISNGGSVRHATTLAYIEQLSVFDYGDHDIYFASKLLKEKAITVFYQWFLKLKEEGKKRLCTHAKAADRNRLAHLFILHAPDGQYIELWEEIIKFAGSEFIDKTNDDKRTPYGLSISNKKYQFLLALYKKSHINFDRPILWGAIKEDKSRFSYFLTHIYWLIDNDRIKDRSTLFLKAAQRELNDEFQMMLLNASGINEKVLSWLMSNGLIESNASLLDWLLSNAQDGYVKSIGSDIWRLITIQPAFDVEYARNVMEKDIGYDEATFNQLLKQIIASQEDDEELRTFFQDELLPVIQNASADLDVLTKFFLVKSMWQAVLNELISLINQEKLEIIKNASIKEEDDDEEEEEQTQPWTLNDFCQHMFNQFFTKNIKNTAVVFPSLLTIEHVNWKMIELLQLEHLEKSIKKPDLFKFLLRTDLWVSVKVIDRVRFVLKTDSLSNLVISGSTDLLQFFCELLSTFRKDTQKLQKIFYSWFENNNRQLLQSITSIKTAEYILSLFKEYDEARLQIMLENISIGLTNKKLDKIPRRLIVSESSYEDETPVALDTSHQPSHQQVIDFIVQKLIPLGWSWERYLIKEYQDINKKEYSLLNLIMTMDLACIKSFLESITTIYSSVDEEAKQFFLQALAKKNKKGKSALDLAINHNNGDVILSLLDMLVNLYEIDPVEEVLDLTINEIPIRALLLEKSSLPQLVALDKKYNKFISTALHGIHLNGEVTTGSTGVKVKLCSNDTDFSYVHSYEKEVVLSDEEIFAAKLLFLVGCHKNSRLIDYYRNLNGKNKFLLLQLMDDKGCRVTRYLRGNAIKSYVKFIETAVFAPGEASPPRYWFVDNEGRSVFDDLVEFGEPDEIKQLFSVYANKKQAGKYTTPNINDYIEQYTRIAWKRDDVSILEVLFNLHMIKTDFFINAENKNSIFLREESYHVDLKMWKYFIENIIKNKTILINEMLRYQTSTKGETAAHIAARLNKVEHLKYLLSLDKDLIEALDANRCRPLDVTTVGTATHHELSTVMKARALPLMTAYITRYKRKRQEGDDKDLAERQKKLRFLDLTNKPNDEQLTEKDFSRKIHAILYEEEKEQKDFFADDVSDNSDSDDEDRFNRQSFVHKRSLQKFVDNLFNITHLREEMLKKVKKGSSEYTIFKCDDYKNPIEQIKKVSREIRQTVIKKFEAEYLLKFSIDLARVIDDLNRHSDNSEHLKELLNLFKTPSNQGQAAHQFFIAQYRGNHYRINSWDHKSRQQDRQFNPYRAPLYSKAIYDYSTYNKDNPQKFAELNEQGKELQRRLSALREMGPIYYEGYLYENPLLGLQTDYTADYKGFFKNLSSRPTRITETKQLPTLGIPTKENILISTSDHPFHAYQYSFGTNKHYHDGNVSSDSKTADFEQPTLRPRWKKNLCAEHPYVGTVDLILVNLLDMVECEPNHIVSLEWLAKTGITNRSKSVNILPERETAYLGYIPANPTTKTGVYRRHVVKFPNFDQYRSIYLHKYGLDEELFNEFKNHLSTPHTPQREYIEQLLMEYLSLFHTMCLLEESYRLMEDFSKELKTKCILLYRNEQGKFSLYPPEISSSHKEGSKEAKEFENGLSQKKRSQQKQKKETLLDKLLEKFDIIPNYTVYADSIYYALFSALFSDHTDGNNEAKIQEHVNKFKTEHPINEGLSNAYEKIMQAFAKQYSCHITYYKLSKGDNGELLGKNIKSQSQTEDLLEPKVIELYEQGLGYFHRLEAKRTANRVEGVPSQLRKQKMTN